ncbi:MAG: tetratricopeptide repeat protein [Pirellulales bacterium]|nr:tetratricopeptide repeat protein [Pirellulales bacterium]
MSDIEPLPTDAEEYLEALNRGNAFFVRGEFAEAIAAFTEAIEIDSNRSLAYYSRCAAHYASGDEARSEADRMSAERLETTSGR